VSLSAPQREQLENATAYYQASVLEAKDYLLARGITGEIAMRARLGVVVNPLLGHEQMVGRLAIPYMTEAGPVDIRFRCLEQHSCKDAGHGKYLTLPGHPPRMFNASALSIDTTTVAVCEGELDTLIVHHHLGIPAVGVPGAQVWSGQKHYPRMFRPFTRVLVFADGDDAGRDLGKQIARDVPQAVVLRMPDGADVTDTFLAEGVDGLAERAGL
jgi:hypothetical protein